MSAEEHTIRFEHRPFGGTKGQRKTGTVVRIVCTCGRSSETGDNYGRVPLREVEAHLSRTLHIGPRP